MKDILKDISGRAIDNIKTAIMITEDSCESGYDSVNNDEFSEWLPN